MKKNKLKTREIIYYEEKKMSSKTSYFAFNKLIAIIQSTICLFLNAFFTIAEVSARYCYMTNRLC